MALVRILVDGYSLLHGWPALAPGQPRHSASARDELIHWLTQYHDATGTPVTVIFDGAGAPSGLPKAHSTRQVEILYSPAGRTADDLIERAAHRLAAYGEVMVVTDDNLERDTVRNSGALTCGCMSFIRMLESSVEVLQEDVKRLNRRERQGFKEPRQS